MTNPVSPLECIAAALPARSPDDCSPSTATPSSNSTGSDDDHSWTPSTRSRSSSCSSSTHTRFTTDLTHSTLHLPHSSNVPTVGSVPSSSTRDAASSPMTPAYNGLFSSVVRVGDHLCHGNHAHVFEASTGTNTRVEREAGATSHHHNRSVMPEGRPHGTYEVNSNDVLHFALKHVSASSSHATREVRSLQHLQKLWPTAPAKTPCPQILFAHPARDCRLLRDGAARSCRGLLLGMELLGEDLLEWTGRYVLDEREICFLAREMLRSLSGLHQHHLVHRSVKPENFCWNRTAVAETHLRWMASTIEPIKDDSPPDFLLKLIDYGRCIIAPDAATAHRGPYETERPYSGWWHSLHGFLGKPLHQKCDLMGIIHTIGFLLDDQQRLRRRRSGKKSPKGKCYADLRYELFRRVAIAMRTHRDELRAEARAMSVRRKRARSPTGEERSRWIRHRPPGALPTSNCIVGTKYHALDMAPSGKEGPSSSMAAAFTAADGGESSSVSCATPTSHSGHSFERICPASMPSLPRLSSDEIHQRCVEAVESTLVPTLRVLDYIPPELPNWFKTLFCRCHVMCEEDTNCTSAEMSSAMEKVLTERIVGSASTSAICDPITSMERQERKVGLEVIQLAMRPKRDANGAKPDVFAH